MAPIARCGSVTLGAANCTPPSPKAAIAANGVKRDRRRRVKQPRQADGCKADADKAHHRNSSSQGLS
jgi:hypothetical protein